MLLRLQFLAIPLLLAAAAPAQGPIHPFNVRLTMPNVIPIYWEGKPALLMTAFRADNRGNIDVAEFWGHQKSTYTQNLKTFPCGLTATGVRLVTEMAYVTDSRPCTFNRQVYVGYYGEPGAWGLCRLNQHGYYLGKSGVVFEWDRWDASCLHTSRFDVSYCSNPYMGPVACLPQQDPCGIGHGGGRGYGPEFVAFIFSLQLL